MRFGSVCSGIEAASVAWSGLGWHAAWFSEIEAFPSAVLAYHYPQVPNLGDMTQLPELIRAGQVEAPDVFCGGTPCQAFSVAGKRQSLSDARGNLSLIFCEIADAIDDIRRDRKEPACVIFWENVPGVLNTKDNAFGCFLAGIAGGESEFVAPRNGWGDAGCVFGPKRAVAWRILDAQYFGLAQRRRRVFVVASARDGFDPAAILFEFQGVRRDFAPSRASRQNIAPTIAGCANGGGANGPGRDVDSAESLQVVTMSTGQGGAEIGFDRGPTLTCNHEAPIAAYAVRQPILSNDPAHAICANEQRTYTNENSVFQLRNVVAQPVPIQNALTAQSIGANDAAPCVANAMHVRRLTPTECERLQGFPDGYTNIPWRGKATSADGPRYKALGNSWAVPVVTWIGRRIHDAIMSNSGHH